MFKALRKMIFPIIIIVLLFFSAMIVLEWGMGLTGQGPGVVANYAGAVNGDEISWEAYQQVYSNLHQQELDRVLPIIERLSPELQIPLSIDTSKPQVMTAAVAAGADMINDVNGLNAPGAIQAASDTGVPVCIMHMQGEPRTMQQAPVYGKVLEDVIHFFNESVHAATNSGIDIHIF